MVFADVLLVLGFVVFDSRSLSPATNAAKFRVFAVDTAKGCY